MRAIRCLPVLLLSLGLLAGCVPTPAPTAAPPTAAPVDVPSPTVEPMATAEPSPTAEPTATAVPSPTLTPEPPAMVEITVYFADRARFVSGEMPFEVAVTRQVPAGANLPEAVLAAFFKGPTAEEQAQGLELITSGFTGWSSLEVQDGIAHLHLSGPCTSHGATYTIAQLLMVNLRQFDEIEYLKIYDENGETWEPEGPINSIPPCLEP